MELSTCLAILRKFTTEKTSMIMNLAPDFKLSIKHKPQGFYWQSLHESSFIPIVCVFSIFWGPQKAFSCSLECSLWKLYFVNETLPLFTCVVFVQTVTSALFQWCKFVWKWIFSSVYPQGDLFDETGIRLSQKFLALPPGMCASLRQLTYPEGFKN